ncbi:hypothetical protein OG218_02685 [Kineococcus sp. NBC_00420]|uniref:hypothetical protein n=1 Tax=Kineococcus sp. NBC_00420 TaxID=2903564 RepID=UPI002E21F201
MDRFELDVHAPQLPADFTAAGASSTLPPRPPGLLGELQEIVLGVFADSDDLLPLDAVRQEVWRRLPDDVRASWLVLVIGGNISATLAHLSDAGHLIRHRRGWSSRRYQLRAEEAPPAPASPGPHDGLAASGTVQPGKTPRTRAPGKTRRSSEPNPSSPTPQNGHPPLADGWEQDPLL